MTTDRRFTVFARPADDGRTPEFVVNDGGVRVSQPFTTRADAQADADRREAETSFPSPHPALTAAFVPADFFETEDDAVAFSFEGVEIADVQILRPEIYGGRATSYSANVTVEKPEIVIHHGPERRTYAEAAADAVRLIRKHGVVALGDA